MPADPTGYFITAAMVALIRLIDAWIAVQAGIPLESLTPRPLTELEAEARRYVAQITADRR